MPQLLFEQHAFCIDSVQMPFFMTLDPCSAPAHSSKFPVGKRALFVLVLSQSMVTVRRPHSSTAILV